MTITQQPDAINFSGNLADILLSEVSGSVPFKMYQDGLQVIDELYYPDTNGCVRIRLQELVHNLLYAEIPDYNETVFEQKHCKSDFSVEIDTEQFEFTVVKGFLQRLPFDVEHFLRFNWLTTQPTVKPVKFHDPEWLTCYPLEDSELRLKGYFANGSTQTITYATLEAGKVQSINVNPGIIIGQFSREPVKWEMYTESGGQLRQYVQTYLYNTKCDQYDDLFVFENRLGGVDTVRFIGVSDRQDSTLFENARFDDFTVDFFAEPELGVQKNTGPLTTKPQIAHALDFFRSQRKHHLVGGFIAGIYLDKPTLEATKGMINSYAFTFRYSDFKTAYPEISIPPQLLELPE